MDIKLQGDAARPLYLQLRDAMRLRLLTGVLPVGARLPATRELARDMHISRNTVEEAYNLLQEEGLIEIRPSQGAFACAGSFDDLAGDAQAQTIAWQDKLTPATIALSTYRKQRGRVELAKKDAISFASLAPDHHEFEVDAFRRAIQDVLVQQGSVLLAYGYTRGYEPLRAYLQDYLSGKGLRMQGQKILICDGFRQGAGLVLRALCSPGDVVAVEQPTYNGFLGILRAQGLSPIGIPCDADGMIPQALETLLLQKKPKVLYIVPTYHNPTGRNMPLERRRQVLAIAAAHNIPVLEDGFSEELRFAGECYPALKALDVQGNVLYVGSFSKVLFPGLRIGWLVVPEQLFEAMEHLKYNEDISSAPLTQAALCEYCKRGGLERHLRRCRPIYRARMIAMHTALKKHFSGRAIWSESEGGFGAWMEFPKGIDTRVLLQETRDQGVLYAPGDAFFPNGGGENFLRLGFSRLNEEEIAKGIEILSDVYKGHGV